MSTTVGGDALLTQQSTFTAQLPPEGPLAIPAVLHFELGSQILVDFTLQMERKTVTAIQSMMVRNWFNADPITVNIQGTQEFIDIPAFADAFLQIATTNRAKLTFTSSGGVAVPVVFFNVPISPLIIYSPSGGQPVIIGGTVDVDVTNPVEIAGISVPGGDETVVAVSGQGAVLTGPDPAEAAAGASHSITTGGTAQTAIAANTGGAAGGYIINPNNATESLFVDEVNAAATTSPGANGTTIELLPGNRHDILPGNVNAVSVNAATTGHTFVCVSLPTA